MAAELLDWAKDVEMGRVQPSQEQAQAHIQQLVASLYDDQTRAEAAEGIHSIVDTPNVAVGAALAAAMPAVLSGIVACLEDDSEGMQRCGELAASRLADSPHAHVATAVSEALPNVLDDLAARLQTGRALDTAQVMQVLTYITGTALANVCSELSDAQLANIKAALGACCAGEDGVLANSADQVLLALAEGQQVGSDGTSDEEDW